MDLTSTSAIASDPREPEDLNLANLTGVHRKPGLLPDSVRDRNRFDGFRSRLCGAWADGSWGGIATPPVRLTGHFNLAPTKARIPLTLPSPVKSEARSGLPKTASAATKGRNSTVVIIDAAVDDADALLIDLDPSASLHFLNAGTDGIGQITDILGNCSHVASLHILSHGTPGCIVLGSSVVNSENAVFRADDFAQWRTALTQGADILLYGCETGAGHAGRALVDRISGLTKANVAASDSLTGHASLGGNWDLTVSAGAVTTPVIVGPAARDGYLRTLVAPVAMDDATTTLLDTPVTVNVTTNDSDADGTIDVTTVDLDPSTTGQQTTFNLPGEGTFSADALGNVTFTPEAGFTGNSTTSYVVMDNDGETSNTGNITVTVTVSNPPTAVDDAALTPTDTPVTVNVTANDSDSDGTVDAATVDLDPLTTGQQTIFAIPGEGTFVAGPLGNVTFTPEAGFTGNSTASYIVMDNDGVTSNTANLAVTVTVTVSNPPTAVDDTAVTPTDTPVTVNVTANDSDSDGTIDAATVDLDPVAAGQQTTFDIPGEGTFTTDALGNVTFTPMVGFTGTSTVRYQVMDDAGLSSNTVSFAVTVNAPPVAQDDALTTDEATALTGNVLADNGNGVDNDPDGGGVAVTGVNGVAADIGNQIALPSGALLVLNTDGSFHYDPNGVFDSLGLGDSGFDGFTYEIEDVDGATDAATVTVTIDGINEAPTAFDDLIAFFETDGVVGGSVLIDNGNGADSDPNNDTLTVVRVNGDGANVGGFIALPSGAELLLMSDGLFLYSQNGAFRHLNAGETDTDSFTYTIEDGKGGSATATGTITIMGVNDGPTAADDMFATDEDSSVSGTILTDNGSGPDSDPDNATLVVIAVNGAATAVGNQITLPSGALLTLNADGTFEYDPVGVFNHLRVGDRALDDFEYTVFDGVGGSDTATVSVTINGVNDDPVAVDDEAATDEASGVSGNVLVDNGHGADDDPDGDGLTATHVNGMAASVGTQVTLPSGALLLLNADGSFTYDPNGAFDTLAAGEIADDSFTYTVDDGNGGTDSATATITVGGINEPPVAADDNLSTDEDTALSGNVLADSGNGADGDPNGDGVTVTHVNGFAADVGKQITLASGARLTLDADGGFVYDPSGAFDDLSPGDLGADGFEYTIDDGLGGTDTAAVSISIDGQVDIIFGTPQEDDLQGTDGDDQIYALASDDIIRTNGGSNMVDGAEGHDTVVYDGIRGDFDNDLRDDGSILVDRPDGETDTLIAVERVGFADGDLVYDIDSSNLGLTYRMYATALGRTADEGGLRFWTGALDFLELADPALDTARFLADRFLESTEFAIIYGNVSSNVDFIDAMYTVGLGRQADQPGRDYWVGRLDDGLGRNDILVAFAESEENVARTAGDLEDGVWVV